MESCIEVFCDFDGTITTRDTIDVLLEELADPAWRDLEKLWESGSIGSRQCMSKQIALIAGGWKEIRRVLDTIGMDPTFPPFALWCRSSGIKLRVVSDGLDRVINYFLENAGITVDGVWSNRLLEDESNRLSLGFPYSSEGCGSGVCKCRVLDLAVSGSMTVVIGDGRSDYCWSKEADLVFAKASLIKEMEAHGKPFQEFVNFESIKNYLEAQISSSKSGIAAGAG